MATNSSSTDRAVDSVMLIPRTRTRERTEFSYKVSGRYESLRQLCGWMGRAPSYVPATWAAHQLGVTTGAITAAVRRGLCRAEVFIATDGTRLMLVSINDASAIGPRDSKHARARQRAAERKLAAAKGQRGDTAPAPQDTADVPARRAAKPPTRPVGGSKARTPQTGSKARQTASGAIPSVGGRGKKPARKGWGASAKGRR